jgi:hypothetical protein
MTVGRRKRKPNCTRLVAACIAVLLSAFTPAARATLTQRIVVDWHSGLAIDGYDPVAYFTDAKPVAGSGDFELRYRGVVWRFSNIGNRAAFAERPDIYMPQYGGYDPVSVAHGIAVAGNPDVWAIVNERLYLFYNAGQRAKFLADSARFIIVSERKWPKVMNSLDP